MNNQNKSSRSFSASLGKPLVKRLSAASAVLLLVSACASPGPRYNNNNGGYGQPPVSQQPVYQQPGYNNQGQAYGQVQSVERLRGGNGGGVSGGGALIGGVLGAVVGNQVGKGSGRSAATVIGAVGGAVAGNEVEKSNKGISGSGDIYRVVVRFENGASQQYDYGQPVDLRPGDRVALQNGQLVRY